MQALINIFVAHRSHSLQSAELLQPILGTYGASFSDMLGCEGPASGARVFNDGKLTYEPLADAARLADDAVLLNCLLTCSHCLRVSLAHAAQQEYLMSLGCRSGMCHQMDVGL